jgi:hypothetical protein
MTQYLTLIRVARVPSWGQRLEVGTQLPASPQAFNEHYPYRAYSVGMMLRSGTDDDDDDDDVYIYIAPLQVR